MSGWCIYIRHRPSCICVWLWVNSSSAVSGKIIAHEAIFWVINQTPCFRPRKFTYPCALFLFAQYFEKNSWKEKTTEILFSEVLKDYWESFKKKRRYGGFWNESSNLPCVFSFFASGNVLLTLSNYYYIFQVRILTWFNANHLIPFAVSPNHRRAPEKLSRNGT